jgi:hypothetical protein
LFREVVQLVNSDFSVPVDETLRRHVKHRAHIDPQLPEHQEKYHCFLIADRAKNLGWRPLAVTTFKEG